MDLNGLSWVRVRIEEISAELSLPDVSFDRSRSNQLMKEYRRLLPIDQSLQSLKKLSRELEDVREFADEKGFEQLAETEIKRINSEIEEEEESLRRLLSSEANEHQRVILEIRSGAGGEEAALFAAMLQRMYMRYAERKGWHTEVLSLTDTDIGGIKEVVSLLSGESVWNQLATESGVHRIQRIPVTESNGKRQTSTATVAVLPDVKEVELSINTNDLRIDVYRASGHGGQYINKTDSAVRITHIPTGIVATCQDEKSQHKNKEKAMMVLRARLYDKLNSENQLAYANERKTQIGTGDRSERIRTYNFNEGRVTDHRLGKTIYTIDSFIDGDMDCIILPLIEKRKQNELTNFKWSQKR